MGCVLAMEANGGENWMQWRGPTADGVAGGNAGVTQAPRLLGSEFCRSLDD